MIKLMDKAHTNMLMEQLISVIGSRINSMVRALKPGQTAHATKEVIRMARKTETVF
jgi:hypothetical protein